MGSAERWIPLLFFTGGVLELVFAANNGAAFLVAGVSFVEWIYPSVLLGRLAVLFGIAGLSVQITDRDPRSGKLCRVVLSVAVAFTAGLVTLSTLEIVGFNTSVIVLFGLGTVVLTIVTYSLFGVVILRTRAFSTLTGGLLLLAAVTVLGVFLGLTAFPTELVGAIGEGVLFVIFLATWYSLRAESQHTASREKRPVRLRSDLAESSETRIPRTILAASSSTSARGRYAPSIRHAPSIHRVSPVSIDPIRGYPCVLTGSPPAAVAPR